MLACLQALLQQNQVEDSLDEFGMAQLINRAAGRPPTSVAAFIPTALVAAAMPHNTAR